MDDSTRMSRRSLLAAGAGIGLATLAGCSGDDGGTTTIRMGGGPQGSATFASAQALQKVVDEEGEGVEISTQETSGTGASNFRLFDNGEIDAGGFDNFTAAQAAEGTGPFADRGVDTLPDQGFFYVLAHLYIAALGDTDIQTTDDLAGKNVWLNPPATSVRPPTDAVLKQAGLWEDINRFEMGRNDLPGALEEGRVDAAVVYGVNYKALPGWVRELDNRFDLRAVDPTDSFSQAIEDVPGAARETIDTYGWSQDVGLDSVDAWNVAAQFRFGSDVSAEAVEEIARIAFDNNDAIIEANAIFPEFDGVETMTNAVIPDQAIHPGMASYLKDQDAWNDDWIEGDSA